jgi:tetratricopeptide (TPR) repeat protein
MEIMLPFLLASLLFFSSSPAFAGEKVVPSIFERANELVKSLKPEDALEALSSYSPSHEEFSAYHYAFAKTLVAMLQPHESIEHYRLAYLYAESDADKERLLLERAEVYAGMGYSSEAVVCFEVFLKKYPKSGFAERAELGIAESRYRLGEFREALAHFERAGSSLPSRYGKANTLQSLGKTTAAGDIYHELIKNDPGVINSSAETLYNIAENHRQLGRFKDAKIFYSSVKDKIIQYRSAIGLGLIAANEGQFDAAVKYFNTAAESPDRQVRCDAIMNRAAVQMRLDKHDEAEAALLELRNGYSYGKQYDTATLLLSKLYRTRGKLDKSVSVLKPLIYQRTPSSAALDELEAIMLEAKERDRDSFVKLWNSVGRWLLDPTRSASLVKIAHGLRQSGRPYFDICTWLVRYGSEEVRTEGRLLLADLYADIGNPAAARAHLALTKITGQNDEVLRITAKAFLADHNPVNASQSLMSVRELREADMALLIDTMRSLKSRDRVLQFCMQTFKKTPVTPQISVRFADILFDTGRTDDALTYYLSAVAAAKAGTKEHAMLAEIEWAHYQISVLTQREKKKAALSAIQMEKNALGRLAAAELRGDDLRRKIE